MREFREYLEEQEAFRDFEGDFYDRVFDVGGDNEIMSFYFKIIKETKDPDVRKVFEKAFEDFSKRLGDFIKTISKEELPKARKLYKDYMSSGVK